MPYFILIRGRDPLRRPRSTRGFSNLYSVWAGFLASGSLYLPRLPIRNPDSGYAAAFVNGYSGGTATELHRFPY